MRLLPCTLTLVARHLPCKLNNNLPVYALTSPLKPLQSAQSCVARDDERVSDVESVPAVAML